MRRQKLATVVLLTVLACAGSAVAQTKDPFRPPGGSAADGFAEGDVGLAPVGDPPPQAVDPSDGLARTGQDVAWPFATGIAALSGGISLRMAAMALGRPRPRNGGGRRRSSRPRTTSAFPYA